MKAVLNYLIAMLPFALVSVPFAALWRKSRRKSFIKSGTETTDTHEIVSILFIMFMAALISQTVIPKIEITDAGIRFFQTGYNKYNLIPFKEIKLAINQGGTFFIVNFIGNQLVFAPIAFFTALLYNKPRIYKSVAITTVVSVFVEVCQIPQNRGSDIDDVILNTLGGIIGYILYMIFSKLFPKFSADCKVKKLKPETPNENTDI